MNAIGAEQKLQSALTKYSFSAADRVQNWGKEVLLSSESSKEWLGPFIFVCVHGIMVTVHSLDKTRF